jgi:hypothetical protein
MVRKRSFARVARSSSRGAIGAPYIGQPSTYMSHICDNIN